MRAEVVLAAIRHGKVGIDAAAVQIRQFQDFGNESDGIFRENAETPHAGIEFEMALCGFPLADSLRADFFRGLHVRNTEDDPMGDSFRDLIIQYAAQNLHRLAETDQRQRLFEFRNAKSGGSGTVQALRDLFDSEPVSICLEHGKHLCRIDCGSDFIEIFLQRVQIDFNPDATAYFTAVHDSHAPQIIDFGNTVMGI